MRLWPALVLAAAAVLASGGCRDSGGDYVSLTGRLFIFNYRVATATYVVTFARVRPVPEGSRIIAEFENPAGGEPLRVDQKVWPLLDKIAIESPPLECVAKDVSYKVTVRLNGPDSALLQKLEFTVLSTMDQSILPDRPLVVGPVYTPNPELAGNPGGKLPNLAKTACPDRSGG